MIYSLSLLQDKGDKAKHQEAGIRLQLSCTRLKILSVKKKEKKRFNSISVVGVEKDHLMKCIILYIIFDFSADNSQISLDSLSKCLKLVNLSIIICFCR